MKLPEYNKLKNKTFNGSLLLIGGAAVLLLLILVLYFLLPSSDTASQQNQHLSGGEATFTNQKTDTGRDSTNHGQQGIATHRYQSNDTSYHPLPPKKLFGRKRAQKLKDQLKESGSYRHYSKRISRHQRPAPRSQGRNQETDAEKAYRKAKGSDIFVGEKQTGTTRPPANTSDKGSKLRGRGNAIGPSVAPTRQSSMGSGQMPSVEEIKAGYHSPISITGNRRFGRRRRQQYPRAGSHFSHAEGTRKMAEFQSPKTPYTIQEGSLIPATLLTSINSDLPGDIIAIVNRNVYDSIHQKYLLIPKGTKLIGSYDNKVVINQQKLLMSWRRMIFPDGRSIDISELNSYDLQGESGLSGKVNNHFWNIFGKSALLSLIGAGTSIATRSGQQRGGVYGRRPGVGQIAARQIATSFNRVANRLLSRGMSRPPTIHIKKGTNFNIFIAGDISFAEPYHYQPIQ